MRSDRGLLSEAADFVVEIITEHPKTSAIVGIILLFLWINK